MMSYIINVYVSRIATCVEYATLLYM